MIFNMEKNNNRNLVDIGDMKSYLLKSMIICNGLDRKTVASIVAIFDYLEKNFTEKQPKGGTVYPLAIQDAFLTKELNRVLKKNKNLDKKKKDSIDGLEDDTEVLLPIFTQEQMDQLQKIIISNNDILRDIFISSAKEIQPKVVISDAAPKPTKKTTT